MIIIENKQTKNGSTYTPRNGLLLKIPPKWRKMSLINNPSSKYPKKLYLNSELTNNSQEALITYSGLFTIKH